MRRIAIATYAINGAQVANMLLTALVVPLLIGAEQYGLYAVIFAVPGFLQSTVESFTVLTLSRHRADSAFWRLFAVCALAALSVTLVFYWWTYDSTVAAWAIILGAALLGRSVVAAMVYGHPNAPYVRISVMAEAVTLLTYAIVLGAGLVLGFRDFTLPIAMIAASAVTASGYMLRELSKAAPATSDERSSMAGQVVTNSSMRSLWAKSYEDFTLTLMPLFLANSFGLEVAGEFRIIVSFMKMASKVFPFRYEVILRSIQDRSFGLRSFVLTSVVFILGGFALSAFLYAARGHFFLASDTELWAVALATGALVASLAAFPLAALYSWRAIAVSTSASFATYVAATVLPLPAFLVCFIAANALTYLVVVRTISRELPG